MSPILYFKFDDLKYNNRISNRMLHPQTPTLRRKSSNKKILISSPSHEMLRFLTLPNPSATEDPRERLRITTPKNATKSVSSSIDKQKNSLELKKSPSKLSRITFIRKKALNQSWGKNSKELRSNKLTLSTNYKSTVDKSDSMTSSGSSEGNHRLNFTFGVDEFQNYVRV